MVARNDFFAAVAEEALPQLPVHTPGGTERGIELGSTVRDALCDYLCERRQAT